METESMKMSVQTYLPQNPGLCKQNRKSGSAQESALEQHVSWMGFLLTTPDLGW